MENKKQTLTRDDAMMWFIHGASQQIHREKFTEDSKIEAIKDKNEISVTVWYEIEKGSYLKIFCENTQLTEDAWAFAKSLAYMVSTFYNCRCNIVDLTNSTQGNYDSVKAEILNIYQKGDVDLADLFATYKTSKLSVEECVQLYAELKFEIDGDKVLRVLTETGEVEAMWLDDATFLSKPDFQEILNNLPDVKQIIVSNIEWDAPKSADLPKEITINIDENNMDLLEDIDGYAENLCDYLSDEYEYCIKGFATDIKYI